MNKPAVESPLPAAAADPRSSSHAALRETGPESPAEIRVGLLTGGDDKPYALELASALLAEGVSLDFIGSDRLDAPELHNSAQINFLNLRGDQSFVWCNLAEEIVPYVQIFQSGVPFLAYSFGLPVIATDVGSLRQDIVEGRAGFIWQKIHRI